MRTAMVALAVTLSMPSASLGGALTTEAQIREALSGQTVSGSEDGKTYAEYYVSDGSIRGRDDEGPYSGEWHISGRRFCMRYFDEDRGPTKWDCVGVAITGAGFAWIEDGERYEAKLAKGNPNNL
jgi:hypothetical protein